MEVYRLPDELEATVPDIMFEESHDDYQARIDAHLETIRKWLRENGYQSRNTGRVYRSQIADGYAEYMLVEGRGVKSFLMHLPYCDGYQDPDVQFLPKNEILDRIQKQEEFEAFWKQKQEENGNTSL